MLVREEENLLALRERPVEDSGRVRRGANDPAMAAAEYGAEFRSDIEAFIVRVPSQLMPYGTATPPPPPSPTLLPDFPGAPVQWTSLVNVSVTNGVISKTSGCDGCAKPSTMASRLAEFVLPEMARKPFG